MDLTIKDVSELLSVSETTIQNWLLSGAIPAYRMQEEYRFSRMEIEDWLLQNRLKFETSSAAPGPQHFCLYRALHQGEVFMDIEAKTKEALISAVAARIAPRLDLDPELLCELLLDREQMMPTGLNHGVAVPHTRDFLRKAPYDRIFMVYPQQPLPYGSLDGQDVHTLFFLFASQDKGHLQLLAKIAHFVSQVGVVDFLQKKPEKKPLLDFVRQWENGL
jgi:PTS system nitrogen regulatory IIA component